MGQLALKIQRPLPPDLRWVPNSAPSRPLTVKYLPWYAAANSNVEIEAVEGFAQRFLRVGFRMASIVARWGSVVSLVLQCEGDSSHHAPRPNRTPILDQPPVGKTPPQWLADMDEAIRVATLIGQKQIEILQHQRNSQSHLARHAQQELNRLITDAQTIRNNSGVLMSGALHMIASADGLSGTATSNATSADTADATRPGAAPNAAVIAAILEGNPSEITTPTGKYLYDITDVASGAVRYPRLEALVDLLVGPIPHPTIIERGSGRYGHLAVSVARRRPIIVIERLRDTEPTLTGVPGEIRSRIRVMDFKDAPRTPTADLAIWIHPYPNLLKDDDDVLDPDYMGQDVKPGGYLVIQTEKEHLVMPETPNWELVYIGRHMGFLAPSYFLHGTNTTLVLRRTTAVLPTTWHELANTHPGAFMVRAQKTIDATKTAMTERITRGQNSGEMITWYWQTVLPEIETISTLLRGLLSHHPEIKFYELSRELGPWATIIPAWLADGHLTELRNFLGIQNTRGN